MKRTLLLFSLFSLLIMMSCGEHKKRTSGEPLQPLEIGVMATMDGFPLLVAADKGIYDSLGLKVNFTIFLTETERDAAFEAHKLDGVVTDYASAIVLQSKGIPLRSVMQNDGYLCLLTNHSRKRNSIKQLKDINIAASCNSFSEYATEYVLQKAGINLERVNIPEINQIPLRMLMLKENQIEAAFLPDPYATIAMSSGSCSIITTEDLNIHQYTTIFSRQSLKEKAESVKALLKGYNIAVNYLATHPENDWADVLTNELKVPEYNVKLIVLPSYRYAQAPNMDEVNKAIVWLKKKKVIKDDYTGIELVDSSYIEKASREEQVKNKINKLLKRHVRRKHK
jgi:NitT/TauT family transport system substrate-binding protein